MEKKTPLTPKAEKTRCRLPAATIEQIAAHGYHNITADDIVRCCLRKPGLRIRSPGKTIKSLMYYPFVEGVSERTYTDEELANLDPPPFEFEGKKYTFYEATQKQRQIETALRRVKREMLAAKALGDDDTYTAKAVRYQRLNDEYDKFTKAAGLRSQKERGNIPEFGTKEGEEAESTAKSVVNSSNDVIINSTTSKQAVAVASQSEIRQSIQPLEQQSTQFNAQPNAQSGEQLLITEDKQFGKKVGRHAKDYGFDPKSAEDREKFSEIIKDIVHNASERRIGTWRGQKEEVYFYIKGEDVVITTNRGVFVTILKGGVKNKRVQNARNG